MYQPEIENSFLALNTALGAVKGLPLIIHLIFLEVKGVFEFFIFLGFISGLPAFVALIFLIKNFNNLKRALKYVALIFGIYTAILLVGINIIVGEEFMSPQVYIGQVIF